MKQRWALQTGRTSFRGTSVFWTDEKGLLEKYLENLEIDKAKSVHFLADGTPWI